MYHKLFTHPCLRLSCWTSVVGKLIGPVKIMGISWSVIFFFEGELHQEVSNVSNVNGITGYTLWRIIIIREEERERRKKEQREMLSRCCP